MSGAQLRVKTVHGEWTEDFSLISDTANGAITCLDLLLKARERLGACEIIGFSWDQMPDTPIIVQVLGTFSEH